LIALLPSGVKTAKWQLTRVKRCRSKTPSFAPGRPTCHGVGRGWCVGRGIEQQDGWVRETSWW